MLMSTNVDNVYIVPSHAGLISKDAVLDFYSIMYPHFTKV